jgi:NAD(P)-dependent dehydrogenase (short-subunit alcohol dehydrogenase family)
VIGDLLDRAMDFTVAPGYSALGYRVRERWWDPIADERLAGRRVLVTGASSGIGEALCTRLYEGGAEVHMLVRDAERGADARRRIEAGGGSGSLELWLCDISDLDEVRRFAGAFGDRHDSLDALVHNAGALTEHRELSAQGRELTFATHVLGPFLLSELLRPRLQRGIEPIVIFVSSGGMYTARADLDDLELERRDFDGTRAYAHAKRLQVVLAAELARRDHAGGVLYCSLHPGWVDTPGLERSLPGFHRLLRTILRDPRQGADTAAWLIASPRARSHPGAFWHDRRPRSRHRLPWTRAGDDAGRRLYAELAGRGGLPDDRAAAVEAAR